MPFRIRSLALFVASSVILGACGSTTAPSVPAQTPASPTPLASAPTPKPLVPVSIAQSQAVLAFAPIYVAQAKGFFDQEGIALKVEIVAGSAQGLAALVGNSVQFAASAAPDFLKAVLAKQDLVAVQSMIKQTISVVVNKDFAAKKGVTRESPIEKRIEALRGAKIASTGPGAISETLPKWLVAKYGMDPTKDIEIYPIGALSARQAALKSGQVDAYLSSGPAPEEAEAQGFGYLLIPASHLPGANNMLHEIVFAKRSWLDKNQETAKGVVRAITRGGAYILENPAEAKQIVAKEFSNVVPEVLNQSLDNITGQIVRTGRFEASEWDFLMQFLRDIGDSMQGQPDTKEGGFWTNSYLK